MQELPRLAQEQKMERSQLPPGSFMYEVLAARPSVKPPVFVVSFDAINNATALIIMSFAGKFQPPFPNKSMTFQ